jgi:hypothetical protein
MLLLLLNKCNKYTLLCETYQRMIPAKQPRHPPKISGRRNNTTENELASESVTLRKNEERHGLQVDLEDTFMRKLRHSPASGPIN